MFVVRDSLVFNRNMKVHPRLHTAYKSNQARVATRRRSTLAVSESIHEVDGTQERGERGGGLSTTDPPIPIEHSELRRRWRIGWMGDTSSASSTLVDPSS